MHAQYSPIRPFVVASFRMQRLFAVLAAALLIHGCGRTSATPPRAAALSANPNAYFDNSGHADVLSGGVTLIPVTTPKGTFKVWTKRIGNNPTVKVLMLHGGPGVTHEYMDPSHMEMMAAKVQKGRFLLCPNGSHLAMYDDQQTYMNGVIQFLRDVDTGRF